MKKMLSFLLVLLLLFSSLPMVYTSADDYIITQDNGLVIRVFSSSEYAVVTNYTGESSNIVIPAECDGYPVTSISYNAFDGNDVIENVIISDGITSVNSQAFFNCANLVSISVPASVTFIDPSAIYSNPKLRNITVDADNLYYHSDGNCLIYTDYKTVIAGTNISVIPSDGSVTELGSTAFAGLTELETIVIPEGVTDIGVSFQNCTNLREISIPDSLVSIPNKVFLNCTSLEYNSYGNAEYLGNANNPYHALIKSMNIAISDCTVHSDTKVIAASAFSDCEALEGITISASVTHIGEYAFYNCFRLPEIEIPSSVISVGSNAFQSCSALNFEEYNKAKYLGNSTNPYHLLVESVDYTITACDIKEGTKVIADMAFNGLMNLASVTMPDTVTHIGESAFSYNAFSELELSSSLEYIGEYAFSQCEQLKNIEIPETVKYIGKDAFSQCISLENAVLPKNLKIINDATFYECTNLSEITLPESLAFIGNQAFYDCFNWETAQKIEIPENVEYIGATAFGRIGLSDICFSIEGPLETWSKRWNEECYAVLHWNYKNVDMEPETEGAIPQGSQITHQLVELNLDPAAYAIADLTTARIYDIFLEHDGMQIQPYGEVKVYISLPEGIDPENAGVFYIAPDGTLTDMNAYYENGYMVFITDHFSYYMLAEYSDNFVVGDVSGDGAIDMFDYLAVKSYYFDRTDLSPAELKRANTNSDNNVDMFDYLYIKQAYFSK